MNHQQRREQQRDLLSPPLVFCCVLRHYAMLLLQLGWDDQLNALDLCGSGTLLQCNDSQPNSMHKRVGILFLGLLSKKCTTFYSFDDLRSELHYNKPSCCCCCCSWCGCWWWWWWFLVHQKSYTRPSTSWPTRMDAAYATKSPLKRPDNPRNNVNECWVNLDLLPYLK